MCHVKVSVNDGDPWLEGGVYIFYTFRFLWSLAYRSLNMKHLLSVVLTPLLIIGYGNTSAGLIYSPSVVTDTETMLSWSLFNLQENGDSQGYRVATIQETAQLFLHYAPPDSGGVLPDYNPSFGGVSHYNTSGDGMSFSVSWESCWHETCLNTQPPTLLNALESTVAFDLICGHEEGLIALVSNEIDFSQVLLTSNHFSNQYEMSWGAESGIISESIEPYLPIHNYDYTLVSKPSSHPYPNPYYTENHEVRIGGYLMVRSVPEPEVWKMVLLGLTGLTIIIRRENKKLKFHGFFEGFR
jgi:hypothetical protein